MYLTKSVEKFLVDQNIEKNVIEAIEKRMTEVSGMGGLLLSNYLEYVMGNNELAQKYKKTCEDDPSLLMFGFTN